ncbi:hypothetical protein LTR09_003128 [Extremus antarcticus]|uniref:Cas1p 10 TM acyl transferase domain-containing protein n=1 Tax=Extremus antarcticus TaxID=702011 RepID=A0AAJ0GEC6_9PEZI|nr:hypothetical protein LTR09_003128 [Extremus antarcticus]
MTKSTNTLNWRKGFSRLPSVRLLAFFYVTGLILLILCRRFIIDTGDPYKCEALRSKGLWYDGGTWLTPGCVTERYGTRSTQDCLIDKRVVFAGDSQLEPLYWAVAQKLDHDVKPKPAAGGNLQFSSNRVDLEYIWDPFLNGSDLLRNVEAQGTLDGPALLIVSTGRDNDISMTVAQFAASIDDLLMIAQPSGAGHQLNPPSQVASEGSGDLLLITPVRETYGELRDDSRTRFSEMNAHLEDHVDELGSLTLWSFAEMVKGRRDDRHDNGWSTSWELSHQMADVVLSLRCNAGASRTRSFPNIRTCCGTWARNWTQVGFLVTAMAALPALVLADYLRPSLSASTRSIFRSGSAFSLAISLQYAADRTHVFEHVQRLPLQMSNLESMLVATLLVGLVSIRRCTLPKTSILTSKRTNSPFLPRDQTDEMKGWMQLLIVIYHYNMAWTADRYWEVIRLAVAAYLFLTGFGHTVYFLQKKDYSLRRVVAMLIRTNLLPCTLAYVMRTRWLLYYYMPLSTFWFLVVYATMAIGADKNKYKPFLVGKILLSAALVHTFINTRDLPETVVRFFTISCNMSFDAREFFHHRVKIDQYIVYVGMLVAIFYLWAKEALSDETTGSRLKKAFRRHFFWLSIMAAVVAAVGFAGFWYYVWGHIKSQSEWTDLQPYITAIPILTFLILRNAHPLLRNFHSAAFAWLGRYSGEMYVMQDHLFLAGDQEAVLRTGLFNGDETVGNDRWRDLVLIVPLYLITCTVIGETTAAITTWFVAENEAAETKESSAVEEVPEVEMSLLSDGDGERNDRGGARYMMRRMRWSPTVRWPSLWPRTVRNRTIVVLAAMWLLNVTYT